MMNDLCEKAGKWCLFYPETDCVKVEAALPRDYKACEVCEVAARYGAEKIRSIARDILGGDS